MKNFVWKCPKPNATSFHLMKWKCLTQPTLYGGMGIADLQIFSKALKTKIIWCTASADHSLWIGIVRIKYLDQNFYLSGLTRPDSTPVALSQLWKELKQNFPSFMAVYDCIAGNGKMIPFGLAK